MKTKSKHTPGPWGRNIPPAKRYPVIYASRNTHVAIVESQGLLDDEIEGNCDLIAAAPELLEVLKSSLISLEMAFKKLGIDSEAPALVEAREIIAKAEGK